MKIIITEEQKNKLFTPKRLSPEDHRWMNHNKSQPIKNIDGEDIQINQYDYDGKKQGYWEDYYDNGQLKSKGNYSNDKKVGVWKHYDENGDISAIWVKETGYFEFYIKGKISSKGYHKNAKTEIFDIEKELIICGEKNFYVINLYNNDYVCEYVLDPQDVNFTNDGMEVLTTKINEPMWYSDLFL